MPLSSDDKRQIAQFLYIAEYYLSLAVPTADQQNQTMGNTKQSFTSAGSLDDETRSLAILGAHLSSAAIRLATIEDVIEGAGLSTPALRECRNFFQGRGNYQDNEPKAAGCSEWVHIMLRDNAGHREPRPDDAVCGRRWPIRQATVVALRFAETRDRLRAIASQLRTLVSSELYGVELWPSP